jgi:multiple sugar transport system substrate-binding protein
MKKLKKTRKMLMLALCALMAAVLFAGCSGGGSGGGSEEGNAETSGAAAETSGPVEITYSFWGTPEEAASVQTVADKFNGEQSEVKVTVENIPHDTYVDKLNTMATANELPDCGIMSEAGVLQFATQGLLADISSMYEGAESKPLDSLAFRSEGKTVAYSAANEVLVLFYNKKMFDDAKVEYPPNAADKAWTWDQFVEAAKKLTKDSSGKTPNDSGFDAKNIKQYGAMVENLTWQLEVWALSNGGGFYSEDGSAVTIDSPETIEAIQKVADLHLKDNVAPLSTGLTDDGVQRSLIAGTVAMTTNGTWNVGTSLNTWKDEGNEYGIAVLPVMKDPVTICTGGPNVVFSQSKNPDAAMKWLKWYSQEDNNWDLIKDGIWMPILEEYYTNEELTHKWVDNPNFPPYDEYKSAAVDYARDYSKSTSWYYVNNTNDFNTLLGSVLGEVWTGDKTAEEAIKANADALKAAYEGNA